MLLSELLCDFFRSRWTFLLINLVELLALDWSFYNSKNSKPNGSASLFRRKVLVILRALIRDLYLAQWFDLLLAALYLKILFLAAKTSLLALPPPRAITPPLCHLPPLPLMLRRLFSLRFLWPNTWRMTSSRSLGPFWILNLLLRLRLLYQLFSSTKALVKGF